VACRCYFVTSPCCYATIDSYHVTSERAIRNIKVKQKVSGQFKADRSAMDFTIRTVTDTIIKNAPSVLAVLGVIARDGFSLET